ncbi:MAG: hypothetical protein JRJ00_12395 [Deltaproteobacteria bacterium]|jgi:hypothetical protein|nr:hypothetical protein [Deltaproteobacteria bacterium]
MIARLKRSLARIFKRTVSRIVSYINEGAGLALIKRFCKNLLNQLPGKATDKFLELLLDGMDLAFSVLPGYSKNIKDFKGRYLFKTKEIETESNRPVVDAAVIFKNGKMKVDRKPKDDPDKWDVRVTFKDAAALRDFIFSRDQDILDSLLANDVEVDGNLNYVYKFGFMVRDLGHRFGVG